MAQLKGGTYVGGELIVATTASANTFMSYVATGVAPLVISSNTLVSNLNADLLDGNHASAFQLALTNPVTGTGTTNYIPKFTGASTIGNSQIFDNGTNVGIGTTSPTYRLDVALSSAGELGRFSYTGGTKSPFLALQANNDSLMFLASGNSDNTSIMGFKVNGTERMRLDASGNVGIGTTTPGYKLEVNGTFKASGAATFGSNIAATGSIMAASLGIGTTSSGVSGEIRATGDITAFYSSDIRLKENIKPIENALDKVLQISGNTYDWKEGFESIHSHTGHDIGVIAQEVELVLPELVTDRESGYKAVQYDKLVAVLIEAIKEQQKQIDDLKSKLGVI